MPGSPAHLFQRFFDVATARRLTSIEEETVSIWLETRTAEVFFSQDPADQRHGYEAALAVLGAGIKDGAVIMAALLHDVGKRHARLGLLGRTVASVLMVLHLPLTARMRTYRDHGLLAARELTSLGVPSLVIDFAMNHHRDRPPTIDVETWDALVAADQPPKPLSRRGGRITSTVS